MTATNNGFIYWKEEPPDRKWKLIPDTEAARNIAIKQGAMFFTWVAFSEEPNNGNNPIRYGDLPLDFDSKEDPGRALEEMRHLCLIHLPELYDLDPHEIVFYCSGSKGFHAVIPASLLDAQNGDPYLPLVYKRIVTEWSTSLYLTTTDHSMYAMGKGKMFRIPNVKRSNGRYKVPLTLEEVRDLPIKELWKFGGGPRDV